VKRILSITAICLLAGCSAPKMSLKVNAAFTQQAVHQAGEKVGGYGTIEDAIGFYLSLPPPPPQITYVPSLITPAPGAPDPYAPLLSFIQSGPQGQLVTRNHLVQLTPAALSLAQLYLSGTVSSQQLLNSAQAWSLLNAAQNIFYPILQPLGLWNQTFLNQWIAYLTPRQAQLISIATALHSNIVAPPPPGQPTVTPQAPIVNRINPIQVMQTLSTLWAEQEWLEIGERFSGLLYPLIKHAGFSEPMLLLYGSRRRYYSPSAQTMRVVDGNLEVHNLNREGYFENKYASGAGRFFQGEDDISLVYFPIEIENERVKTLDVVASDRFALLKKMSGGDTELLSRAFTHNTSMLSIDAAFGNRHLRVVGGVTPYSSMGGVMGELTYNYEHLQGRIGGGGLIEAGLYGGGDTFIGFLDMEHKLSSPFAILESKDKERAILSWATLTLSASGMTDRSLGHQPDKRSFTNGWGFQGDVRLIPELHTQLDATYFSVYVYGGVTTAVVPSGKVDLIRSDKSVMIDLIRHHVGLKLRVLVSEAVKLNKDKTFGHTMYADAAFVTEMSDLVRRWRFTTDFTLDLLKVGLIGEFDDYQLGGFDDFRLGGRASFMGAYIQGLKSLEFDDFQIQAGIEIRL